MWHCISCGREISLEDVTKNEHRCDECRRDEWMERRALTRELTERAQRGTPMSNSEFNIIDSRISKKYSRFADLDR